MNARQIRTWLACAALFALAATQPQTALAWGNKGHEAIGWIATKFLKPGVAVEVEALLAREGEPSLAAAATWGDRIKHKREGRGTDKWHYVDIPVTAGQYDAERDCTRDSKPDNCVVAQLETWVQQLRGGTDAEKAVALKWVAHLVGDIHQPLHAAEAEHNGVPDAGGNKKPVTFFGKSTNLHALWDTGLIEHIFEGREPEEIAAHIAVEIPEDDRAAWQAGTPVDWANEAHELAVRVAYGKLPQAEPYERTRPVKAAW